MSKQLFSFLLCTLIFCIKAADSRPCAEPNSTCKALIIMGASCSGKSTLSEKLVQSMGNQWKMVELDVIEDELKELGQEVSDEILINAVVTQTNALLAAGWHVIIDTNIYHEQLRSIETPNKKFVLVYCPLAVLLERNTRRDRVLQRTAQKSARAREYVEKTFANFEQCDQFDIRIDSSMGSIEEELCFLRS